MTNSTIGIGASFGSQSPQSESHSESQHSQASMVSAGSNLNITATGKGAGTGNISITGSKLLAGTDMLLNAKHNISLDAAQSTEHSEGKNSSKGGNVGAGVTTGSGGAGFNFSASVNGGKGHEQGNSVTNTVTTLAAGNTLYTHSGGDTTLNGAMVSGDKVLMDVGGNLNVISRQDSDRYDSKQVNGSAGAGYTLGAGGASGSVSLSRDQIHSNYDSVVEQSGIFAGKDGFDINVGQHTQLDGGVIASTAPAESNQLSTGTLGWSDLHNRAEVKSEHQGAGLSSGGSIGGQFTGNLENALLAGVNHKDSAQGTTYAAVSPGTLVIRDSDQQQQEVAELNRDVEHANGSISPIFDKEKEQNRLKQGQLIAEIGSQAADIVRTQGTINATREATDRLKNLSDSERDNAAAEWQKSNPNKTATAKDISDQAFKTFFDQAMNASGMGTGGWAQRAVQAATAVVQGLAGGDIARAIAGGSAPYIAEVIGHQSGLDAQGKLAAHALVNAVLAVAQGNSALAGVAGAATGEVVGILALEMYGKKPDELSESEKQTVSALATAAAGLAGGLVGDSTADAVAGGQAGKTTVENNWLAVPVPVPVAPPVSGSGEVNPANGCHGAAVCVTVKKDGSTEETPPITDGPSIVEARDEADKARDPNVAKDLTADEKAELGGSGSGTPGGWGPEDEENARKNPSLNKNSDIGKWSVDELSDGAKHIDPASKKGDLTLAGRALQKHGSRPGSAFPSAKGSPSAINEQGQKIVDSILNDPNKTIIQSNTGRYGQVTDIFSSQGKGLRYDAQGKLIGFLEPPK